MRRFVLFVAVLLASSPGQSASAQTPAVLSTLPLQNELNVPAWTDISVTFDADMDEAAVNDSTFVVSARSTGFHHGAIGYEAGTRTATFHPAGDFAVGDVITVVLTTAIQSSQGIPLGSSHVWSFTVAVEAGPGTFAHDSVYPVGHGPNSAFAADFDGDGDIDLAIANDYSHDISVLLNEGDGTFDVHSTYGISDAPSSICAADFDCDDDIDLVSAIHDSDHVVILLNDGDGAFALDSAYPVDGSPFSVIAADLDGDGHFDIVTGNGASGSISVLSGNGDGTFASHVDYLIDGWLAEVLAGDFDGDGDLDLVIMDPYPTSHAIVLLNDGGGTFSPGPISPVDEQPFSFFAADLDGDNDLDLATVNIALGKAFVLLNEGDATFLADSAYQTGDEPISVFAADLDGDSDLDLIVANYHYCYANDVSVLLNNGDGTFAQQSHYLVSGNPSSVLAVDLDGDGRLDIVTANPAFDNVSVLLSQCCIGAVGNVDCSQAEQPDVGDIQTLIDRLFIHVDESYCCLSEADVDLSGQNEPPVAHDDVDIGDMQLLIDHLFIDMDPLPACP